MNQTTLASHTGTVRRILSNIVSGFLDRNFQFCSWVYFLIDSQRFQLFLFALITESLYSFELFYRGPSGGPIRISDFIPGPPNFASELLALGSAKEYPCYSWRSNSFRMNRVSCRCSTQSSSSFIIPYLLGNSLTLISRFLLKEFVPFGFINFGLETREFKSNLSVIGEIGLVRNLPPDHFTQNPSRA